MSPNFLGIIPRGRKIIVKIIAIPKIRYLACSKSLNISGKTNMTKVPIITPKSDADPPTKTIVKNIIDCITLNDQSGPDRERRADVLVYVLCAAINGQGLSEHTNAAAKYSVCVFLNQTQVRSKRGTALPSQTLPFHRAVRILELFKAVFHFQRPMWHISDERSHTNGEQDTRIRNAICELVNLIS